jgi:hypothetical protein
MAAELKIHRGCTIDHIEVAVQGETRPCKYHTIPYRGGHFLRFHVEFGLQPPPVVHGFRHTNHVVKIEFLTVSNCIGFLGWMKFEA